MKEKAETEKIEKESALPEKSEEKSQQKESQDKGKSGSATKEKMIKIKESEHGLLMTGMKNFQIVNGGQTTASIHAASRNRNIDLSKIFVQMKLSIIDADQAIGIVPKISQYANT